MQNQATINFNPETDLKLLAAVSSDFITISTILLLHGQSVAVMDVAIMRLQEQRAFLERFTPLAIVRNIRSPIDVLDQVAKKFIPNTATAVSIAETTSRTGLWILSILINILNGMKFEQKQVPVNIDPEKKKSMN
jgi:hypothetical protein